MSESSITPNDVELCLKSVSDTAQGGQTKAFAGALIDLLWSVSDARPDLDRLPVLIANSEKNLRDAGTTGDIAAIGMCVKQVLVESAVSRLPKAAQKRARSAVADLDNAASRGKIIGLARAVCSTINLLAGQEQQGTFLPVVQDGGSIKIGRHFSVTFHRTLRIPDDGKTYPLPAALGEFPLHSVADYADRVPPKWLEHGGFFMPMYQSEAMFLSFGGVSWRPNIAKVGVGKINAVTGKPWDERIRSHEQDYLLCPEQQWLDGINAGAGFVRQFVAMPLGKGYTVEEQITDEDHFGGVQIVAYDPIKGTFPEESPYQNEWSIENANDNKLLLEAISGLPEPFRSALAMAVLKFSADQIGCAVSLSDQVVSQYEAKACAEDSRRPVPRYKLGDGKRALIQDIQREGLLRLEQIVDKRVLKGLEWQLFPGPVRYSPSRDSGGAKTESMGVAAGGKIKQQIIVDPYGSSAWDEHSRGVVWIHLVNTKGYQRITGKQPPNKPMDSSQYQRMGLPWFAHYEERPAVVAPSPILSKIKAVFAIDRLRGRGHAPDPSISVDPAHILGIKIPSRQERITALLAAAEAAARAGRHKSSSRLATAVLDLDSLNPGALCMRGEAQLQLMLYKNAWNDAEAVIQSDSANWRARRIRAEAALKLGMPEVALAEAAAALRVPGVNCEFRDIVARAEATVLASKDPKRGS